MNVITKQTVNHYDCMCIQKRANRAIQTSYYLLLGWFSCITCAAAKDKLHRRNFGLSQKLCAWRQIQILLWFFPYMFSVGWFFHSKNFLRICFQIRLKSRGIGYISTSLEEICSNYSIGWPVICLPCFQQKMAPFKHHLKEILKIFFKVIFKFKNNIQFLVKNGKILVHVVSEPLQMWNITFSNV